MIYEIIMRYIIYFQSPHQKYNVGLNFADVGEANNFKNEIDKKLKAKQQRRNGKESFLFILKVQKVGPVENMYIHLGLSKTA